MSMRICCVSDLHGNLPEIPPCDLLLIGGDIVPTNVKTPAAVAGWLDEEFAAWLERVPASQTVGVAGNHDFLFQENPELVPEMDWIYLQDSGTEFEGLKIWGTPWQPTFFDWAFNLDEPQLCERWSLIPEGTDILLLHGPPHGVGDFSEMGNVHTGSPGLLRRIEEVAPRLAVFGHIHSGHGRYRIGGTVAINAALVDDSYVMRNAPLIVELD